MDNNTQFSCNVPLTDDTYMECRNVSEYNKDQRLASLKNSLSFTNLWLGIIAAYFLIQTIKEIIFFIVIYNAGMELMEIIQLLGNFK